MSLTSDVAKGVLLSALVIGPVAAQPAGGEPSNQDVIAQLASRGLEYFQQGKFREAVSAYQEAYRYEPVGALLYNIAFIYDKKLEDYDLAIDYYRRFVNAPDADPDTRLAAYERLQVLYEQKIEKGKTVAPPVATTVTPPPPPPDDKGQRIAGWVTLGTGVALMGVGGAFGLMALGTQSDYDDAANDAKKRQDLRDQGEQQALIADVAIGVGAAAAVTGAILLLTADGPPEAPAKTDKAEAAPAGGVGFMPTPEGGFGFSLSGTF
ncbi:MAG: tetratricopeptide repeat protein [Myxococcales bacterium]|nr:tetratricopeptide repeat protein [Myxococcales bacterium]